MAAAGIVLESATKQGQRLVMALTCDSEKRDLRFVPLRLLIPLFLLSASLAAKSQTLTPGEYQGTVGSLHRPIFGLALSGQVTPTNSPRFRLSWVNPITGAVQHAQRGVGMYSPDGLMRIYFEGGSRFLGRVSKDENRVSGILSIKTASGSWIRGARLNWIPPEVPAEPPTGGGIVIIGQRHL
jgi:hypothetical protein